MTDLRTCGKQTRNGAKAKANLSRFAPCVLPVGHREQDCDSGKAPAPDPAPPKAA